ncbi:DUF5317 domain-containing protein [Brassicibacter mesophilus]|uniref:DUF5317 domain-containing protein n=1 Tax=Brassicibacter mesophilus TaxID=745119 RepID=UPI003D1CE6F5
MLIESLLASIVIGLIRGGKLSRFSHIRFTKVWTFILAVILQVGIILFGLSGNHIVLKYIKEIYIASYVLLFIGILLNINYRSLWVVIIGTLANLFVFFTNGGKTPISVESLKLIGFSDLATMVEGGKVTLYTPLAESTKYAFLGDIITVPQPYPYPQILSVGDIIIALGLFLFVQSIMLNEGYDRANMIRFKYRGRL